MNEAAWDFRNPYLWREKVENESFAPLMIEVAVTGEFCGKETNPGIPETAQEQIEAVFAAYCEGATVCHILARDPVHPSKIATQATVISQINEGIRARCPGMVINNSLAGGLEVVKGYNLCCLEAECKPDLAGLKAGITMLGTTLPERGGALDDPRAEQYVDENLITAYGAICGAVKAIDEKGVKPVLELYQPGQYWVVNDLLAKGLIAPTYIVELLFGFRAFNYAHPSKFMDMLRELPKGAVYFGGGESVYQLPMNMMSMINGGHVRVGLEDNTLYRKGEAATSSAQLVARAVRIAGEMNRTIASTEQTRQMLGLK